ncbi:MAG TPA: hypothetical protein VGK21_04640 [Candidatus Angelobacter sp.]|jgi:hypothetical protein
MLKLSPESFPQWFETTIAHRSAKSAFTGIVIPRQSISRQLDLANRESLLEELELVEFSSIDPQFITEAIQASLVEANADYHTLLKTAEELKEGRFGRYLGMRELAERVSNDKCIPFQESPLDLHSIKDIVAKGTGTAIGAYVGFVAAGSHPLVLIVVPAGIIVCGAAFGIAKALEQGLQERLLAFMGVPIKRRRFKTPSGGSGSGSGGATEPTRNRKSSGPSIGL